MKTVQEGDDSNIGMIGSDLLDRCRNAIIVNLANEALVDEVAISNAIESGTVAAYSVEASANHRESLSSIESVHFAPSNAWNSDESMQTLREVWVGNMISAIGGKPENVYTE